MKFAVLKMFEKNVRNSNTCTVGLCKWVNQRKNAKNSNGRELFVNHNKHGIKLTYISKNALTASLLFKLRSIKQIYIY